MMHFEDTEVQMPAHASEVMYWLSKGEEKIFRHKGKVWLSMRHYKGHRIMIPITDHTLSVLGDKIRWDGMVMKLNETGPWRAYA